VLRTAEELGGWGVFDDGASVHHDDAVGHALWRTQPRAFTTTIVIPSRASSSMTASTFADELRVERRGWLVEKHHLGIHDQRPRDGNSLLLATG